MVSREQIRILSMVLRIEVVKDVLLTLAVIKECLTEFFNLYAGNFIYFPCVVSRVKLINFLLVLLIGDTTIGIYSIRSLFSL